MHAKPILLSFFVFVLCSSVALGQESYSQTPIEILKGQTTYDSQTQILHAVTAEGVDPTVILGERSITAESITFDQKEQTLEARGNVRLWDQGAILQGEHLTYSLQTEEGTLSDVKDAELVDGVFFKGESLSFRRFSDPDADEVAQQQNEYTLINGQVTTCDLPVPHYHLKVKKVRIIPNDRMWAEKVVLKMGDTSLFYFPMMSRTLADHELTYFLTPASFSHLGYGLFNRVMYKPNDKYTLNVYGDYYTDAGFGKGAKFTFDVPSEYHSRGEVYGYHIKQEDADNDFIYDGADRYNLYGWLNQDLPYDVRLTARGHQFSDSEYRHDYHSTERLHMVNLFDLEKDVVSFVNLSKVWDDQSLRFTAASRLDSFYYSGLPYVEREPQLHFESYPSRILGSDFLLDYSLDYGRYRREEGVTYPADKYTLFDQTTYRDTVDRFDARFHTSRTFHPVDGIAVKPWVGYRATHYADPSHFSDDSTVPGYSLTEFAFNDETRSMVEGGVEISTRQVVEFDSFLNRYKRMRAVFEPVVQYGYFHPDIALEELGAGPDMRFPYIDLTDEYRYQMHRISTMFRTKIQGKDAAGTTSEFLRFGVGVSYDQFPDKNLRFDNFEFFEDPADNNDNRFSDLVQEFSITPFDWISFGNNIRFDIEDSEIRSSYYYSTLRPLDTVRLSMGYYTYRYPSISLNEQEDISLMLQWAMSKKWEVFLNSRYDLDENVFRWNRVGLMRDLHDFYAIFQVEHEAHPTLGDDYSLQFGFRFWGIGGRRGQSPDFY
jgi:lipopolysaccharide assembly outer membrane protein LptD (OstA)